MIICTDYVLNVLQSRFDILKIHSRKMNLMRGIDLKKIAEKMNGASGAELKVYLFCNHKIDKLHANFCSYISPSWCCHLHQQKIYVLGLI